MAQSQVHRAINMALNNTCVYNIPSEKSIRMACKLAAQRYPNINETGLIIAVCKRIQKEWA